MFVHGYTRSMLLIAVVVTALFVAGCPDLPKVSVPDCVGLIQLAAETAITGANLKVGTVTEAYSDVVAAGNVIGQTPGAGTSVSEGSSVGLAVSKGALIKADLVVLPRSGAAPLDVAFSHTESARANEVASWAWDFDNDGDVDSTEASPIHTYEEPGDYSVSLTIETTTGEVVQSTVEDVVSVRERTPVVVRDSVIIVDNQPDLAFVSKTDTELMLEYTGLLDDLFYVGDVVVGTHDGGYARRVLSVAKNGDLVTLTTENVALTDIFEQGDLSSVVEITEEDLRKAGFVKSGDGGSELPFENVSIDAGVHVTGSISFEPNLDWDCRLAGGAVDYFSCVFTGTLAMNYNASLSFAGANYDSKEISLLERTGGSTIKKWVVAWIGCVPVAILVEFDIKAGVEAGVEGAVSIDAGYSSATAVSFGAEYEVHNDPNWSVVKGLSLNTRRYGPEFNFEAGGYAKVYIKPEGKLYIYGILGPKASIEPYVRADLAVLPLPELSLSAGIDAAVGFSFVDLNCIGIDFVVDCELEFEGPKYVFGNWPLVDPGEEKAKPAFSAMPLSGRAPLLVSFVDESDPGDGAITKWRWDFGDGSRSSTQSPTHTYTRAARYQASLTVEGTTGAESWAAVRFIDVLSAATPPSASFDLTPTMGPAPLTVYFVDTSSPGTAAITSRAWDFDGNGTVDSNEQTPTFVYETPGVYNVLLVVSSSAGSDAAIRYEAVLVDEPTAHNTANHIVVFRDNLPWSSSAFENMMSDLDYAEGVGENQYEIRNSSEMGVVALKPGEDLVIITNDQNQTFYNNLAANMAVFLRFLRDGGSLLWGGCDQGWAYGSMSLAGIMLPQGVQPSFYLDPTNYVILTDSPLTVGLPNELTGNYSSHEAFDSLPPGAIVYTEDTRGLPTLIEYQHASGSLIVTGQPLEWGYDRLGEYTIGLLYPNLINYVLATYTKSEVAERVSRGYALRSGKAAAPDVPSYLKP